MKTYRISTNFNYVNEGLLHISASGHSPIEVVNLEEAHAIYAKELAFLEANYKKMSEMGDFSEHLYNQYVINTSLEELVFDEEGEVYDLITLEASVDFYDHSI